MDVLRVAGRDLLGTVVPQGGGYRLRIFGPEWEFIDVPVGHTVEVNVPGKPVKRLLVAEVVEIPQSFSTWVVFIPPIRPSAN